jgi:transposase-like protein
MLVRALRRLYGAIDTDAASAALEELEQNVQSAVLRRVYARWRDALPHLAAFFDLPSEVRQVIYTSDALERVHMDLRRIINMKARRYFSSHEAAMSLLWLAAVHTAAKWERSDVRWTAARDQLARLYGTRFHAGAPSEI